MKRLLIFFLIFSVAQSYAQSNLPAAFFANKDTGGFATAVDFRDYPVLEYFYKSQIFGVGSKDAVLDGSLFLYDKWENVGVIEIGKTRYTLSNINYHIEKDAFMSKLVGDSIMVFDSGYLDKITVNNVPYKSIYNQSEGKHKIYEVVYEGEDFSVLKGYSLKVTLGSPNPMVNRPNDQIKKRQKYFVLKNNNLTDLKLAKKDILKLVDENTEYALVKYAKDNKLSFKKERDIKAILSQINNE